MTSIRLTMAVGALLAATSCATVRLTGDELDALHTIEKYIGLDRSGARLDNNRYHSMAELSAWTDEPTWDAFVVVSTATIGRPRADGPKMAVRVRYEVEGVMEGDSFLAADALPPELAERMKIGEPLTFTLVNTGNGWKVESPQVPPRVGFPAARSFARALGAKNAERALDDAEYVAKLKGARSGHCNCQRLDF